MIAEIVGESLPIAALVVNESLIDSINSLQNVTERRLRIDIQYIRETVKKHSVCVNFIESSKQLVDILTKVRGNKSNC